MSCNHANITAESYQYHEGYLICVCCGLVVSPGQLVSESYTGASDPPMTCPILVGNTYDRGRFFIRWLQKFNQQKFGLDNEQVAEVTQVYRSFCTFYVKEIAEHVARAYIPPTRWLVPRIIEDVLGLLVPEPGVCQIKTPSILIDFDTWWAMFLDSKKKNA
jgi:hypothetical protein